MVMKQTAPQIPLNPPFITPQALSCPWISPDPFQAFVGDGLHWLAWRAIWCRRCDSVNSLRGWSTRAVFVEMWAKLLSTVKKTVGKNKVDLLRVCRGFCHSNEQNRSHLCRLLIISFWVSLSLKVSAWLKDSQCYCLGAKKWFTTTHP